MAGFDEQDVAFDEGDWAFDEADSVSAGIGTINNPGVRVLGGRDVEVVFYAGFDNAAEIALTEEGLPLPDHTLISRMVLIVNNVTIDSSDNTKAGAFDFKTYANKAVFKMGPYLSDVGSFKARLHVYSSDNPRGIVWTETLPIKVKA